MRRLAVVAVVLLGAIAIIGWRAAPTTVAGPVKATGTNNNSSVHGSYAFSDTFHDPITFQEGAAVGSMVFNGAGSVTGTYSQTSRCTTCGGDAVVTRAPYAGTYVVRPDGTATLDVCITLPTTTVRVIWEGAFSTFFFHFRFIQMANTSPCVGGTLLPQPNVTSGTADKL